MREMDLNHADKLGTNGGWAAADVYFIAVPFISHEPCKGADFMPVSSSKKSLVAMQLSEHKFNNISKIVACLDTTFVARRSAKVTGDDADKILFPYLEADYTCLETYDMVILFK